MKSKIVLSFDDGRKDNYEIAKNILLPRDLKATFNIITGWADETKKVDKSVIASGQVMTVDEINELNRCGFEIASHSDSHLNDSEDILISIKKLKKWLNIENIGFASPNSKLLIEDAKTNETFYRANNISYIRIGMNNKNGIIDGIYRHIPSGYFYSLGYQKEMLMESDDYFLFSVPIIKSTPEKYIEYLVNKTVAKNKNLILMFHSINELDDTWSWPRKDFINLCNFLKENTSIDVCNTMDLISGDKK